MHQIIKLDGYVMKEMDIFIANCNFTEDETLPYLRSRITFWLFHQLLKGTTDTQSISTA